MSRGLSASNIAEVDSNSYQEVVLVNLDFDTPVFAHSGIGTITYDSDDYLGVGDFGAVDSALESEQLGTAPIQLTLSGVDATLLSEALDSGNYGDVVTVYVGYRQDDGTLVDDPWVVARGKYDYATVSRGADNSITIVAQNDLAVLNEKSGRKFTNEDQLAEYSSDTGFEHVTDAATIQLQWGGRSGQIGGVTNSSNGTYDEER